MTTGPAVQAMPRERAAPGYDQLNEQRYRQQVDEELQQKHDKRSNLVLGRGKSLILSSPDGLQFALALDDDGFITVTDYSTGDVGELTVRFDNVEGLAQEFIDVRAEFAAADGTISSAYIAADAVVAADAASANASLSTTLTAAFTAADSTVASNAAALVTSEASTRASADTAIAATVTTLTGRVTTAENDINTVEATASAIDARLIAVEGSYATASSVTALTAEVTTLETSLAGRGALNANPLFDEGPAATGVPPRWTSWNNGSLLIVEAKPWGAAGLCVRSPATTGTPQIGVVQTLTTGAIRQGQMYRMRSEIARGTGTLVASGMLVEWLNSSSGVISSETILFATAADTAGVTATGGDGRRIWEKVVTAPALAVGAKIYALTAASSLGTLQATSPTIRWFECSLAVADGATTGVVTNSAAITTLSTTVATGDAANATSITNLSAKVRGLTLPDRPSEADDFTGGFTNTTTFAAPALTEGTQATIANEGVVRQFTSSAVASNSLANRAVLQIQTGKTYEVRLRARVTTDATTATNVMAMGFRVFNASGTYLGDHAFTTTENPFNVADGWLEETVTATAAAILSAYSTAAYIRAIGCVNRRLDTGGLNNAVTEVAILRLSDITLGASVTVNASAIADIEGRLAASYSIQVDGGGNGALVSLEDGTTLGSVVKLAADKIELRADALDLGTDTTFEATHDTFYTTAGSYRFRYGGPFGTSSDLLQWYGPTSVSLNSETKTNGVFALATDGKVYLGTAELVSGGGANSKAVTQQNLDLDIDTSGTAWVVGSTFDMTVGTPGFLSVNNSSLGAGFTSAISAGSTFNGNWRITEATQADPTTKTVVWSGTFVADSGGGSVEVSGFVSPASPVLATKSGACRYTLEVQRASGTNNVTDLTSFLSLTWTPSG